jgi:hypothetical protein
MVMANRHRGRDEPYQNLDGSHARSTLTDFAVRNAVAQYIRSSHGDWQTCLESRRGAEGETESREAGSRIPGFDALFNFPALTCCMKWLWLSGAGFVLATAYYGQGVSGLERLTLFTSALLTLWIFDWRS